MPLVILSGNPCTGKTTFANHLCSYLKKKDENTIVELINEESLKIPKKEAYMNATKEKLTRGALKSETDHKLNAESYVIIDSMNYIKGFRYELYCTARTFRTPHCAVWVESGDSISNEWNKARRELSIETAYDVEIMEDLRRRFEAPNSSNRWDNPLFKVSMNPDGGSSSEGTVGTVFTSTEQLATTTIASDQGIGGVSDMANIEEGVPVAKSSWRPKKKPQSSSSSQSVMTMQTTVTAATDSRTASVTSVWKDADSKSAVYFSGSTRARKDQGTTDLASDGFASIDQTCESISAYFLDSVNVIIPATASTMPKQHGSADHLYELDRISQKIAQMISVHQTDQSEGTPIKFADYDREIVLHRYIGSPELQRHRRQYVKINSQHHSTKKSVIEKEMGAEFIDFLASQL